MPTIEKPNSEPLQKEGNLNIPAMQLPSFRILRAVERNIEKKLLFRTAGGIGDFICAEPTFRYALNKFKDSEIYLCSDHPELYQHLKFKGVIKEFNDDDYLCFTILEHNESIQSEFVCHLLTHCVDYTTLCMFRSQLPVADKCVQLIPSQTDYVKACEILNPESDIVIHAGMGWQSKTFPKSWWNEVIARILEDGLRPVLIGANSAENRGTVDVNADGCLDLRNKLSLMESVAVLKTAKVLLTNDSSPLHMAASGSAWIGFVSTVRHPDHLYHYRDGGKFAWRMKNLSRGGAWENFNICPNNRKGIKIDEVDPFDLLKWLPEPQTFAQWGINKLCLTPQV